MAIAKAFLEYTKQNNKDNRKNLVDTLKDASAHKGYRRTVRDTFKADKNRRLNGKFVFLFVSVWFYFPLHNVFLFSVVLHFCFFSFFNCPTFQESYQMIMYRYSWFIKKNIIFILVYPKCKLVIQRAPCEFTRMYINYIFFTSLSHLRSEIKSSLIIYWSTQLNILFIVILLFVWRIYVLIGMLYAFLCVYFWKHCCNNLPQQEVLLSSK